MKISVIIPTLNEADYLKSTIGAIQKRSVAHDRIEIIVVDSGSADNTCELAEKLDVILLKNKNDKLGKAHALNKASEFASGQILMFLDADTVVPVGFDELILSTLSDANVVGGAFEFSLDGQEFGLRVVEIINRTRYRIRQRFYGDQGIFVRAEVFNRVGGFPEMGLLESAYLCRNLRKEGELKLVKVKIQTSPRRFLDGGIYRVLGNDIKIWFLDLIGVDVERYTPSYWTENKIRAKR